MPSGIPEFGCKLQFSGHETFPLRYGWLKKVYDAVLKCELKNKNTHKVFSADDAIAVFGVGKNMVSAMRHWSVASGIIDPIARAGPFQTTSLGRSLLDDSGWDPWLENPGTLWLLHWQFASTPERTSTWYWVFNHYPQALFDRDLIINQLKQVCSVQGMKRVATTTLKRDVDCFIHTYSVRSSAGSLEDSLECPLTELALFAPVNQRAEYQLTRSHRPTLTPSVFTYATGQFWQRAHPTTRTMSFETLMHEPGSPGRVFQLDEESLMDLVLGLETTSQGVLTWSETAGMRQLICHVDPQRIDLLSILDQGYGTAR